jgi:hypothetical protein
VGLTLDRATFFPVQSRDALAVLPSRLIPASYMLVSRATSQSPHLSPPSPPDLDASSSPFSSLLSPRLASPRALLPTPRRLHSLVGRHPRRARPDSHQAVMSPAACTKPRKSGLYSRPYVSSDVFYYFFSPSFCTFSRFRFTLDLSRSFPSSPFPAVASDTGRRKTGNCDLLLLL